MATFSVQRTLVLLVLSSQVLYTIGHECPTFWTAWRDHCYRYYGKDMIWVDALETCRTIGGIGEEGSLANLVSIHSQEEEDFVYYLWRSSRDNIVDPPYPYPGLWIGMTDRAEEGTMVWSDGTSIDYRAFFGSQPNNYGGAENFVHIWDRPGDGGHPHNTWNDCPASWTLPFVCKQPSQNT